MKLGKKPVEGGGVRVLEGGVSVWECPLLCLPPADGMWAGRRISEK